MKKQTVDSIYCGFGNVSILSGLVLIISIVGYYSMNELGIKKYNDLFNSLIPVALAEFVVSIGVVNVMDYKSMRARGDEQ